MTMREPSKPSSKSRFHPYTPNVEPNPQHRSNPHLLEAPQQLYRLRPNHPKPTKPTNKLMLDTSSRTSTYEIVVPKNLPLDHEKRYHSFIPSRIINKTLHNIPITCSCCNKTDIATADGRIWFGCGAGCHGQVRCIDCVALCGANGCPDLMTSEPIKRPSFGFFHSPIKKQPCRSNLFIPTPPELRDRIGRTCCTCCRERKWFRWKCGNERCRHVAGDLGPVLCMRCANHCRGGKEDGFGLFCGQIWYKGWPKQPLHAFRIPERPRREEVPANPSRKREWWKNMIGRSKLRYEVRLDENSIEEMKDHHGEDAEDEIGLSMEVDRDSLDILMTTIHK